MHDGHRFAASGHSDKAISISGLAKAVGLGTFLDWSTTCGRCHRGNSLGAVPGGALGLDMRRDHRAFLGETGELQQ
jgi:hypothetical protein